MNQLFENDQCIDILKYEIISRLNLKDLSKLVQVSKRIKKITTNFLQYPLKYFLQDYKYLVDKYETFFYSFLSFRKEKSPSIQIIFENDAKINIYQTFFSSLFCFRTKLKYKEFFESILSTNHQFIRVIFFIHVNHIYFDFFLKDEFKEIINYSFAIYSCLKIFKNFFKNLLLISPIKKIIGTKYEPDIVFGQLKEKEFIFTREFQNYTFETFVNDWCDYYPNIETIDPKNRRQFFIKQCKLWKNNQDKITFNQFHDIQKTNLFKHFLFSTFYFL